jgi:hypothetical protein
MHAINQLMYITSQVHISDNGSFGFHGGMKFILKSKLVDFISVLRTRPQRGKLRFHTMNDTELKIEIIRHLPSTIMLRNEFGYQFRNIKWEAKLAYKQWHDTRRAKAQRD